MINCEMTLDDIIMNNTAEYEKKHLKLGKVRDEENLMEIDNDEDTVIERGIMEKILWDLQINYEIVMVEDEINELKTVKKNDPEKQQEVANRIKELETRKEELEIEKEEVFALLQELYDTTE